MKVSDAIDSRISCRAYTNQPVPAATLRAILDAARRAPSGGNVQPWWVYALTGNTLEEFIGIMEQKMTDLRGEGANEYDIYPAGLGEPYRSRRFKCGEDLYATIDIPRDDKPARLRQLDAQLRCSSAPPSGFSSASIATWARRNGRISACTCRA